MGIAMSIFRRTASPAVVVRWLLAAALILGAAAAIAAAGTRDLQAYGTAVSAAPADAAITRALRQISAQRIQHTIETLVAFRTRNTLSSMDKDLPKGVGINAAADWIESQLQEYSRACGGCLEVRRDTFTQSPKQRVPRPTTMVNIYAVLRGSDP